MEDIEKRRESTRIRMQRFRAKQKGENMQTRKCQKCSLEKGIEEFTKDNSRPDGLQTWCKLCHQEYQREYNRNPKINPRIGDISPGRKIGKSHNCHFVYAACESCGKPRWVELLRGKPRHVICTSCAQKGHPNRNKRKQPMANPVAKIDNASESITDPMQNLDNFFDGMGKVATEIKSLRQQCNDLILANYGLGGIIEKQNSTIMIRNEECDGLKTSNNILIETITSVSKELDTWKFKALKWSGQLVNLQEILARPSR